MRTGIITTTALCVAAGTVAAGPTWVPDDWYSPGYGSDVSSSAGSDYQFDNFNAFGIYFARARDSDGSSRTMLDWNASGAHSEFDVVANSAGYNEGVTFISFTAVTGGEFEMSLHFEFQGSGAGYMEVLMAIQERDGAYHEFNDYRDSPGSVSTSYSGTLVAGKQYWVGMLVQAIGGFVGTGAGSGDMTLSVVPLPSASALAGLGLLGLGVRRRRGSL
ncbi:MAG: hypothetical protein HND58_11540 [Planctomycetota bacterium]|nr:MAG: hypothetical protein HND58_11540 [Planctomycetota bacterium]